MIDWKEGAVCFAGGLQFGAPDGNFYPCLSGGGAGLGYFDKVDFQLNEMRIGDYIEASELDTEQKYNDAVEVFELFGFSPYLDCDMDKSEFIKQALNYGEGLIADDELDLVIDYNEVNDISQKIRKITYPQLMAIGGLKPHETVTDSGKKHKPVVGQVMVDFIVITHTPCETTTDSDVVKNPNHYQLMDGVESIEVIARSMTQEQWKGFCLGNMLKYRIRAGKKDKLQQDIDKANFYGELYETHKGKCYQ